MPVSPVVKKIHPKQTEKKKSERDSERERERELLTKMNLPINHNQGKKQTPTAIKGRGRFRTITTFIGSIALFGAITALLIKRREGMSLS